MNTTWSIMRSFGHLIPIPSISEPYKSVQRWRDVCFKKHNNNYRRRDFLTDVDR